MSQSLTSTNLSDGRTAISSGFYGKIPARGDFVGVSLPARFVDPWHQWVQQMLLASRAELGDAWLPAWLEAPVWRFAFAAGVCGPDAAIGLWMPSVDRVGRHFPLAFAAVVHDGLSSDLLRYGAAFLAAAERAGLDALERDIGPEEVVAQLLAINGCEVGAAGADPRMLPSNGAQWWTDGSPRVPATTLAGSALPDEATFAAMLDASAARAQPVCTLR